LIFSWGVKTMSIRGLKVLEDEIQKIRQKNEVYIISPADVEYYSKCMHLQKEVRDLLLRIELDHLVKAMEALKYLQPFARKRAIVELERKKYGSEILVVGHSIYTTWTYQNPEEYSGRKEVSIQNMFYTIFKYKDKIVPLLRKTIREDFLEIVGLVEEIQRCLEMEISRRGLFRIWSIEGGEVEAYHADKICISATSRFYRVHYSFRDEFFASGDISELEKFFEVYEVIYDILTEAHQRLREELKRNEERLKQIKEIVAPYVLANGV